MQHAAKLARPLADTDCDVCTEKAASRKARGMQRSVPTLKQLTLLRVHRRRLGRRNSKAAMLKQLSIKQEATVTHAARHLRRAALQVERRLLHIPPRRGNHTQQVAATLAYKAQRTHA
eukprot:7380790-Prymnesium_polylepis.1